MSGKPVIEEAAGKFRAIVAENDLGKEVVQVKIGTLTVKQAMEEIARIVEKDSGKVPAQ